MEQGRCVVEEIEALEMCVVESLRRKRQRRVGTLEEIKSDFAIAAFLNRCVQKASAVVNEEQDMKSVVENEITTMKEKGLDGFYAEKERLDESYSKYPREDVYDDAVHVLFSKGTAKEPQWSGEEHHGRFLDLHSLYHKYINIIRGLTSSDTEPSYVEYLGILCDFDKFDIARVKSKRQYSEYLLELLVYLESFHKRVTPLSRWQPKDVDKQFHEEWSKGILRGWEHENVGLNGPQSASNLLKGLGKDCITRYLLVKGAKVGGTPEQRADRLKAILAEAPCEADKKILRKAYLFDAEKVALMETKVRQLVSNLSDYVDSTKSFVTRKQTRTWEENHKEYEEEERRAQSGGDHNHVETAATKQSEGGKYGYSRGLPLDFDGKPIPLWLYKLHGLGVEYTCEICGNYVYKGRRAYEKHFQDARHANAMRILGIPNTKHFHEINKIDDARALYEKLKGIIKDQGYDANEKEEFEDAQGNVFSRKEYLDLKRQGLWLD